MVLASAVSVQAYLSERGRRLQMPKDIHLRYNVAKGFIEIVVRRLILSCLEGKVTSVPA